ncbi:ribonuclease toxin immunity protein CdiI, partial [Aeromonas enteropelogenes]
MHIRSLVIPSYVSEETCYHYVRLACERFLTLHPEHS